MWHVSETLHKLAWLEYRNAQGRENLLGSECQEPYGRAQPEHPNQRVLMQWPRLVDLDSNKYLVPRATSAD